LVDLFEYMMMHGLTNPKFKDIPFIVFPIKVHFPLGKPPNAGISRDNCRN